MKLNKLVSVFVFIITRVYLVFFLKPFISDLEYYRYFAQRITQGEVPYKDFSFEYPPIGLLLIYLPEKINSWFWGDLNGYRLIYHFMCLIPDVGLFVLLKNKLKDERLMTLFVLISALMGPLYLDRLDVWLAWTMALVIAAYSEKSWKAPFLNSVGIGLKLVSVFWTPYLVQIKNLKKLCFQVLCALILPVLLFTGAFLLSPTHEISFLSYHSKREFQVESILSSFYWLKLKVFSESPHIFHAFGGWNLEIPFSEGWKWILRGVFVVFSGFGIYNYHFKPKPKTQLPEMIWFTILLFFITSNVLSPQFMIWLIPVAFLNTTHRSFNLLFTVLCISLTIFLFYHYGEFIQGQPFYWGVLVFRNTLIFIMFLKTLSIFRTPQHLRISLSTKQGSF